MCSPVWCLHSYVFQVYITKLTCKFILKTDLVFYAYQTYDLKYPLLGLEGIAKTMLEIRRVNEPEPMPRSMVAEIIYASDASEMIYPSPQFKLSTYNDLSRQSTEGDHVYTVVNQFFSTLSLAEQHQLYTYYVDMHNCIQSVEESNLRPMGDRMTALTTQVMTNFNITHRLIDFVNATRIPFPEYLYHKKEFRVQDSEQMTFHLREYIDLTAISLFAKMMSPIWGEYINVLSPRAQPGGRRPVADEVNKELFCFILIIPILDSGAFSHVFRKLRHYSATTVNDNIKEQNKGNSSGGQTTTFILARNGYETGRFQETVYAVTVIKKLVIYDVWKSKDGLGRPDIMKYIRITIGKSTHSKMHFMRGRTKVMTRFDLPEGSSGTDNTSNNDNVARVSKTTADVPIIARMGIMLETKKILSQYDLSISAHADAVRFYIKQNLEPSIFNRALAASLYAKALGGSSLLQYLPASSYIPAIVALQMVLIQKGELQLATLLTCSTNDLRKPGPISSVASRIQFSFNLSVQYKRCITFFAGTSERPMRNHYAHPLDAERRKQEVDHINVRSQIERLMTWIIDFDHFYNISPALWEAINPTSPPPQGELITYDEDVVQQVCQFFIDRHGAPALS